MADYKSMTVAQLKEECTSRGLQVSGTKAVIIARLEGDDASKKPAKTTAAAPAKKTAKKAAPASRKRKAEEITPDPVDAEEEVEEAPAAAEEKKPAARAAAPPAKKGKGTAAKLDQYYRGTGTIFEDKDNIWDVMLMQVSIERNNNKFYVLQLIDCGGRYDVFTRWGRVNEPGQNLMAYSGPSLDAAKKAFAKKFKDKTKNNWGPGIRDTFIDHGSAAKTYALMDMADAEEAAEPLPEGPVATGAPKAAQKVRPCTLDPRVQSILSLCFDKDTVSDQLQKFKIDTNRMPIGRISKAQLQKGAAVLEKLAKVVAGEQSGNIKLLSSEFYTYVPQSFGRNTPPAIDTREKIQEKFDLINTLTDMTIVQDMLEKDKSSEVEAVVDHPLDRNYKELDCEIEPVEPSSDEYKYVSQYFEATKNNSLKLREVFRINRKSEAARYAKHDDLGNRKLLWHGTNVAVVVAILKTGLRIMPHSGGRVGRGIYHASENSKSSGYTGTYKKTGVMFIDEVALGKSKEIMKDDSSLTKAPAGYDSVLANGWTEPDPSKDIKITLDGREVTVPQGKAIKQAKGEGSYFSQSEYLVYQESQVRMRYMLRIDFPY